MENSKPSRTWSPRPWPGCPGARGVLLGDSTWDAVAAGKPGVPTIGLRTGGFSPEELHEAGAVQVFDSLLELREKLDETLLGRPAV